MNLTPEQKREASAMFDGNCSEMMPEVFRELVWLRARVAEFEVTKIKSKARLDSCGCPCCYAAMRHFDTALKQTTQQPPPVTEGDG